MHVTHGPRGHVASIFADRKHNMAHFLLGSMSQVERSAAAAAAQKRKSRLLRSAARFEVCFGARIKECALLLVG